MAISNLNYLAPNGVWFGLTLLPPLTQHGQIEEFYIFNTKSSFLLGKTHLLPTHPIDFFAIRPSSQLLFDCIVLTKVHVCISITWYVHNVAWIMKMCNGYTFPGFLGYTLFLP